LVTVLSSLQDWLPSQLEAGKTTVELVDCFLSASCLVARTMPAVTHVVTYSEVRNEGTILIHRITAVQTLVATLIGTLPVSATAKSNG